MKDQIDEHIADWAREIPTMDPRAEGIVLRLQYLVRLLSRAKQRALTDRGLTIWEYQTMLDLRRRGEPYQATPTELATMLALSPAAMTKRLDAMTLSGYVRREHDTADRRRILVTLTDAGNRAWEETIDEQDRVERTMIAALDTGQQDQLIELLRAMVEVAGGDDASPLYPWRG